MIHPPVPPAAWAAEGARVAGALEEVAAALVIGSDPAVARIVAEAIARAQPGDRRVAIADLVGDDGAPGPGLLDCIRDGLPVSAIAVARDDDARVFTLPAGGPEVGTRLVLESARWPRLVAGFREVDALLLLVVRADAPGLPTLLTAVDGVVAVDLPPVVARAWPLLATVDRPEEELPPLAPPRPPAAPRGLRSPWGIALAGLVLIAAAATWRSGLWRRAWSGDSPSGGVVAVPGAGRSAAAGRPGAAGAPDAPLADAVADTITLAPVVNPGDSAVAAAYAVELVAANTPAGANSALEMPGVSLPAPTLVPVELGAGGRPWHRALAGAWPARTEAEAYLASLRARGLVREDVGRVLRAPYALLLAEGVPPAEVSAAVAQWTARGIPAYALRQDDGSARVYAGAFETPGQSVLVALSLRDLGTAPVPAFRTGRAF